MAVLCALTAGAAAEERPESQPYRVRISIAFDTHAALSGTYRQAVLRDVADLVDRSYAGMWDARVVENGWLVPATRRGLQRIDPEHLKPLAEAGQFDKLFCLTIAAAGARYDVAAREWDAATQTLGAAEAASSHERGDVPAVAVRLIQQLFQPVLTLERVEGDTVKGVTVVLRTRAGRLRPGDPQAAQVQPGDLLEVYFRYLDQQRVIRRIQKLPWTWLIVESVDGGRVKSALVSGLRSPLAGGRRRSVEVVALRVRPRFVSTQLKLVRRSEPLRPLVGYRVTALVKRRASDPAEGEPLRLVTDRRGMVTIPAGGDRPLLWLYVRSGKSLLSRVPFVPGLVETATMELPDDSIRLSVEGATDRLMNRLIDTVARRAVLMSRARLLARDGDWKSVDEQVERLGDLPDAGDYEHQLTLIRVPALEAARTNNDAAAAAAVQRNCEQTSQLIQRYLNDEPLRTLKSDLAELRKLDAEDRRLLNES